MIENKAVKEADRVLTCSENDKAYLSQYLSPSGSIYLVPNGADASRFYPFKNRRAQIRQELNFSNDRRVILFAGSHFSPNQEAFDYLTQFSEKQATLLEKLRIHFLVVGTVSSPVKMKHLTALGKVDEVEPYFIAADAAINPVTQGSGTNIKMYEYLAAGLPILSTPFGCRGIDLPPTSCQIFEREKLSQALEGFFS
jgi:glycosyltransferase involved in cell wall biosynthesis